MKRRELLRVLWALPARLASGAAALLRGKLGRDAAGRPVLETAGRKIRLEADEDTRKVLGDARLAGYELELEGEPEGPDAFRVGPFYRKSLRVLRGGKKFLVSYWCDVCSIRSYTPGLCVCCQQETELDLVALENEP
jgi:hypothetical protein